MRAYLKISAKNKIIAYDHRDQLIAIIRAWLGIKDDQEKLPFYSFSRFENIRNTPEGISFFNETAFFFSSPNTELVKNIHNGVKQNPSLFNGLRVIDIELVEDPDLSKREVFYAASPLIINPRIENKNEYILYNHIEADTIIKEITQNKLAAADIIDETFHIEFDKNYVNAGAKKITYNEKVMRASWCQIILKGLPETKRFIWNIGLGDHTELGFGAIM